MTETPSPENTVTEKVSRTTGSRPTAAGRKPRAPREKTSIPEGAKQPTDHQSAKTDVEEPKSVDIEWGEDAEGKPYVYSLTADAFDDLEFVEALLDMEKAAGDEEARTVHAMQALRQLLGPKDYALYKERSRNPETGRVTFSGTIPFFNHVMTKTKRGNSESSPTT